MQEAPPQAERGRAHPGPGRRPRRPLRTLAKVGLAAALTLLLLEAVLRLLPVPIVELRRLEDLRGYLRLDAAGRVESAPGFAGRIHVAGRDTEIRSNSLGLRGPELPPKAPGERRILMLGDSFVFGFGVAAAEAVPAVLEELLAGRTTAPVRVGNAGMFGTGPREWAYTLDRYRSSFQPDAVIACTYAGNDPGDTLNHPLSVIDGWLVPGTLAHRAAHSWRLDLALRVRIWLYLEWHVLLERWPISTPAVRGFLPPGMGGHEGYFLDVAPAFEQDAPWIAPVLERLREPFAAFARAAADLPSLVVVLPGREASSRELWRTGLGQFLAKANLAEQADRFERGACSRRLADLARREGLSVLDLTGPVLALDDPPWLYLPDYHYRPEGCRRIAELILPAAERLLAR